MDRPDDLFDREREWADLAAFVSSGQRGLQIGLVYGRRRQGKSFLLRRLVTARRGIYSLALEEQRRLALERFGRSAAEALGLPTQLRFDDWTQALRLALGLDQPGRGRLVVLDEFPYLLHGAPELASAIQAVYDDARNDPTAPAAHLVLCGSAFTIMSELLSGARPLRGRSRLDLVVPPFDYRTARDFWGITRRDRLSAPRGSDDHRPGALPVRSRNDRRWANHPRWDRRRPGARRPQPLAPIGRAAGRRLRPPVRGRPHPATTDLRGSRPDHPIRHADHPAASGDV